MLAAVGVAGFFSYRCIRRLIEIIKLSKTLPEYLRDIIGEKPDIDCNITLPLKAELSIGLSKETKEREKNLQETIENYVQDFYPLISNMKMVIKIYELQNEKEKADGKD